MTDFTTDALMKIALTRKGKEREILLKDDKFRCKVLNSGANVTLYGGDIKTNASNAVEMIENIYIGLIQRKNKAGNFDGLGAFGGLAERTSNKLFHTLNEEQRLSLVGKKDDVILSNQKAVLINNIDKIRQNNVLREMKEELFDLNIEDITLDANKIELVFMPNVRDDNYITNIWNGCGECFAVNPYCHIYKDDENIIDKICAKGQEKQNGEVSEYRKIALFDALKSFGNRNNKYCLEDGRDAQKDYRYAHEYLVSWAIAKKILKDDDKLFELALSVQNSSNHPISFRNVCMHTKQSIEDIAITLSMPSETLLCMENALHKVYRNKKSFNEIVRSFFHKDR
ncbi:MAG: hypothetical protein IKW39_04030 [Alphaproteobacteria bacterium]|nr:hypothetical protein [Alphaproteobacteria bacterium]